MRAGQIQQQLKINAQTITGLHSAVADIRESLHYWRIRESESPDDEDAKKAVKDHVKVLPKFSKKLKTLGEIQKQLKTELSNQQMLAQWAAEDEAFWNDRESFEYAPPVLGELFRCDGVQDAEGNITWGAVEKLKIDGPIERVVEVRVDGVKVCDVPPIGWYCTREPGHEGPCAAWPVEGV